MYTAEVHTRHCRQGAEVVLTLTVMSREHLIPTALGLSLREQVCINCWDQDYRERNSIRSWLEWEVEDLVQIGHAYGTLWYGLGTGEGVVCEDVKGVPFSSLQKTLAFISYDDTYHRFVPPLSGSAVLGKMLQLNLPQHLLPHTQLIGWQPSSHSIVMATRDRKGSQPLGCETIRNSVCMCTCMYACAHTYTHVGTVGFQFLLYTLKIQTQTRIMKLKASNSCLSEPTPRPNMFLYDFNLYIHGDL